MYKPHFSLYSYTTSTILCKSIRPVAGHAAKQLAHRSVRLGSIHSGVSIKKEDCAPAVLVHKHMPLLLHWERKELPVLLKEPLYQCFINPMVGNCMRELTFVNVLTTAWRTI